ncbi:hypothetical protein ABZ419_10985 [Streptomyces cinnamoneus]|uniref:hypothetical protein n=1 Tax=Streptomyces cinnamoneus TaxID=53446 RepID=UPI0033CAD7A9
MSGWRRAGRAGCVAFVAVLATAGAGPAPGDEPLGGPPAAAPRHTGPHTAPPAGRPSSAARRDERAGGRPAQAQPTAARPRRADAPAGRPPRTAPQSVARPARTVPLAEPTAAPPVMSARTHPVTTDGPAGVLVRTGPDGCLVAVAHNGDGLAEATLCPPPPPPAPAPPPPAPAPRQPPRPEPVPVAPAPSRPAPPVPVAAPRRSPQPPPAPVPSPPPSPAPAARHSPASHIAPRAYRQSVARPAQAGSSLVMLTLVLTAPAVLAAAMLRPRSGGGRSR